MRSFFKDTNFDFDKFKIRSNDKQLIIDAYYIPEDEICPVCGSCFHNKNGYKTKTVKHCVYQTKLIIVKCHIQRYKCKTCSSIFYEKDTFSYPGESISKESIATVMEHLKYQNETFESVARSLHISRQDVINIFDKYYEYIPGDLPEILSFDEKHINKSLTDNAYIFVILDFKAIKIYDIVFSRHKAKLERYFSRIPLEQRSKVKYITMDMWETYLDVAKRYFKNAKIAIDSFHVMKLVNNAMDTIRKSVMKKYYKQTSSIEGSHPFYYVLKKYSYYFLQEFDDIRNDRFYIAKFKRSFDKHDLRKYMLDIDDNLKKAYKLTSKYREFNKAANINNADEELEELIDLFYDSGLKQFIDVANTLSTWKPYIINSFIRIEDALTKSNKKEEKPAPRRLSNGPIEGINAILAIININGKGYTNFYRYKNRCIYVVNK